VQDLTFIRGDGAFDVVALLPAPSNAAVGRPLGLDLHLDRLESTCHSLRLEMPKVESINDWVHEMGRANGPGICRMIITRGQSAKGLPPKCIMLHEPPATYPPAMRLKSMAAPWHFGYALPPLQDPPSYSQRVDIDSWTTVKWMSYAPNCLMTRVAQEHGADDAMLIAADGRVLDGPNFAIGFVIGERLRLVHAGANRMLPSCTQMLVVKAAEEAGLPLDEGIVHTHELKDATACFAMSATRHVMPVSDVDERKLGTQDTLLQKLRDAYWRLAEAELQS